MKKPKRKPPVRRPRVQSRAAKKYDELEKRVAELEAKIAGLNAPAPEPTE